MLVALADTSAPRIPQTFEALASAVPVDALRPWLEYYRRDREVQLLVPVRTLHLLVVPRRG